MAKIISRFVKRYIFFLVYFSVIFAVGGAVFEFILIPALVMISFDAGYQFPTAQRFIFMAKFIALVSPVCAGAVSILIKS